MFSSYAAQTDTEPIKKKMMFCLRETEWMNEWTLFYEGSGEDSRSFYIQPLPMRETTIN